MIGNLDFSWLSSNWALLGEGLLTTIRLIVICGVLGTGLGIFCAWVRSLGPRLLRPIVGGYVEVIRNTPFLAQLFFVFFGLPSLGVQMNSGTAAGLAMTLNLGAYSCEIFRAGIQATPRGQFEAAASLALTPIQSFFHVVLRPALARVWPAICSQIIIVMLDSAVVSQISVQDLTYSGNFIQSRTFRVFEVYALITMIYLVLAIVLRRGLDLAGRSLFAGGLRFA